MNDTGKLD